MKARLAALFGAIILAALSYPEVSLGKIRATAINQTRSQIKLRSVDMPIALANSLDIERARPLELASGDFDEDGAVDLAMGYAADGAGAILLERGNPDPASRSSDRLFSEEAKVIWLPEAPEFLFSGDFNRDGHQDLIAAARGGEKIYLIAGDGRGNFEVLQKAVGGRISVVGCGEIGRVDGSKEVIVALEADGRGKVLIFRGGFLGNEPEVIGLPGPASAVASGDCDGDGASDLALGVGRRLFIIDGLTLSRAARLRVGFAIASIAIGEFAHQARLALLGADGAISLWRKDGRAGWEETQRLSAPQGSAANRRLLRAKTSGMPTDDLIIIGGADLRLLSTDRSSGDLAAMGSFEMEGEAVAALTMLINKDALDDILVLKRGSNPLAAALTEPQSVFVVTSAGDSGTGTLRNAIMQANNNAGPDLITFNISPGGPATIQLQNPLPSITEAVTIDGTTQPGFSGSPLVVIDGRNIFPSSEGVLSIGSGLSIMASNCAVLGIGIINFEGDGIEINGSSNVIQGNTIGAAEGGNSGSGVRIQSGNNNTIGRRVGANPLISNPANTITLNQGSGVSIISGTGNSVLSNRIFSNVGLGIDLGDDGITQNDPGDADTGPNNLQNFPVLTAAVSASGTTRITGTLSSAPNTTYTIEFFSNAICDSLGNGEGQEPIGSIQVTTATDGGASFTATLPTAVQPGRVITATATDPAGNTSEFSRCVTVQQAGNISDLSITKTASSSSAPAGSNVTFTIVVTNSGPDAAPLVTVTDNLPAGTSFVSCNSTGGGVCGGSGNNRSVTFSSLGVGASATITIVARIECSASAGQTLINTASVSSASAFDPNESNNAAQASFVVASGVGQLSVDRTSLSFGPVEVSREAPGNPPTATILVRNSGCVPISLTSASFTRVDPIAGISNPDDSSFFSISPGLPISISPLEERSIVVGFRPRIPDVAGGTSGLSAREVLPSQFRSELRLNPSIGSSVPISITSQVSTKVKLFSSSSGAPAVTLSVSGDEFIVTYNVFDSNLDISRAQYVFFTRSGEEIRPEPAEIDLSGPIRERGIRAGQSISVEQRFSGARSNRDVVAVQVTVFDGEGSDTARSGSAALASFDDSLMVSGMKLRLPKLRLPSERDSQRMRR